MNEDFKFFKLGELAEIIAGGDKPKIFSERKSNINCIPVVANGENKDGLLGYTDLAKIVEAAVTISARGSKVGFAAIRKQPFFPIVRLLTLIPIKERLDVDFLYYKLKQNRQGGTGSGQPQITIPDISNKSISVPSLPTQQKIAAVLSTLDNKIELNNQINTELEAMAKTLSDYWFVQFDFPFDFAQGKPSAQDKPNENGTVAGRSRGYKSSGGKMVFDQTLKREIPEGWEVKKLGNLGNFKNGVNYDPSKPGNIACPIINVRNISKSSFFIKNEDLDIIYLKDSDVRKYSVNANSIIIARSGIPGATRLISDFVPNTLYCGFAIHYEIKDETLKDFVFFYLKSLEEQIKNGSGGTILKNVNQSVLNNLETVFPTEVVIRKFNNIINPIFSKINNLEKQNQELAQIRDWLLPMLMNGQVRVGSTEYESEKGCLGIVADEALQYNNLEEKTSDWYDQLFELWVSQQGLAARGNIDKATLRELFDAMNDEDK